MSTSQEKMTGELFSEYQIYEQLQKIFLCPAFAVSEILQRFLTYIVQEALAKRSNTIKEYTIAVHVLNKPVSFKPQHDAIVRIHAGRLRRALHYYYKETGKEDKIEITVPKGSYVPIFVNRTQTNLTGLQSILQKEDATAKIKLVVLPFISMETGPLRLAFSDSLGQQLCDGLSRYQDFSIMSYFTARRLNLQNKEVRSIVSEFGARFIVSGNVLFENRKIKVFAKLTDASDGSQIWTECYRYTCKDSELFAAADEITAQILGALGDYNGLIIKKLTRESDSQATGRPLISTLSSYHDFYLGFNENCYRKSFAAMEKAVELDAYNDVAWSFLGQLTLMAEFFNQQTRGNAEVLAQKYARRAIRINPLSQHGYITLGMAHLFLGNKENSLEALEYAHNLNTSASGLKGIIGCLMISAGEYDQGIALLETSMEINKYFPPFFYFFTTIYHYKQNQYARALQELEKSGLGDDTSLLLMRISILVQLGRKTEAEVMVKTLNRYALNKIWAIREFINRLLLDAELLKQLNLGFKTVRLPILTVA